MLAAGGVAVIGNGKLNALTVEGGKTTLYDKSRVLEGMAGDWGAEGQHSDFTTSDFGLKPGK